MKSFETTSKTKVYFSNSPLTIEYYLGEYYALLNNKTYNISKLEAERLIKIL